MAEFLRTGLNVVMIEKNIIGGSSTPLETQSYVPWGVAVRLGNPVFRTFIADTIADWYRTGLIIELQKKYDIPLSSWAQQMHDKYAEKKG